MVRFTKIVYYNGLVRFKTTIREKSRRKKKLCTPKKRLDKLGHNHDHGAKLHVCSISCMKTVQVHEDNWSKVCSNPSGIENIHPTLAAIEQFNVW